MRATTRFLALLLVIAPLTTSLNAQGRGLKPVEDEGSDHDRGPWLIVGAGYGQEGYRFDGEEWSGTFQAPSFQLAAGGRASPRFLVGLEWNVWADQEELSDQQLHAVNLIGMWYPVKRGLFFKGGFGLGFDRIETVDGVFNDTGFGMTVGLGLDLPIARNIALLPKAEYYIQTYNDPGQENDYQERLLQVGVGVHFR
jgi:opacity protein-like surface antigen